MRLPVSQVGVVIALLALGVGACESPARVKPWRHAPDPTAEAAHAPGSPVLAEDNSEAAVFAARPHTLRIHMDADPGRLTPVVDPSLWATRITVGTIFEPLLRYVPPDAQGPARYTARLARSWRVMPSGLEIRIELQPGVTFHDGRPLTTSDVQFTLDAMRTPHKGADHLRAMLDDVEAVELITPLEIRLRLKRPSSIVLRALAEIPILPMAIYDGSLLAGGALVGTGPWKFGSNKNGIVHLVRNDKYWDGTPPIADVEFVVERDAAVALTAAKRGELDIIPALIPAHWPEQASAPGLAASFVPLQLAPPRLRYFQFNAARPLIADARVRHALALLIDRRGISKRVFDGLARPVNWPIWPGGPVDGAEAPVPDFDPAAAGKLLDAAGWVDTDKDGIRDQGEGKQLKLVLYGVETPKVHDASGPPAKTERDYFVEAARRAGVVIEVKTGGESWLDKKLGEGQWDIVEIAWNGRVDMDITPLVAGRTPIRPVQPRVDHALDAMAEAWDPAERGKLAKELADALAESWPIAGIVADAPQGLAHRRLQNVRVWNGWVDLSQLKFVDESKPSSP
ncbi:MAG TPA: ABC transporter substrate-binding protein [Kofleriaceae bacterium]|nr:ABC transporter substrate-binding protein [Kofleriaceae bacterium]